MLRMPSWAASRPASRTARRGEIAPRAAGRSTAWCSRRTRHCRATRRSSSTATGRNACSSRPRSPLRERNNEVAAVLTTSVDITDRKRAESHLLHLAHHDALTDLPNRTLLRSRLHRGIARARRGDASFALHIVDLDGFKTINDVHGHSAGDKFLKLVAQRLRSIVTERDTVARLGGDEFAIVQTRVNGTQDAVDLAMRIIAAVNEPQSSLANAWHAAPASASRCTRATARTPNSS